MGPAAGCRRVAPQYNISMTPLPPFPNLLKLAAPEGASHTALPSDLVEVRVKSGSGRILHRHVAETQKWGLPGGSLAIREHPRAAAARSLMELTGYEVPEDALVSEGLSEEGETRRHVFSVAAGRGRQKGKPKGPILWMQV